MQIQKGISLPAKGMNRDSNIDRLQDGEFTFALNSDSNGRVRHNEPSNYLYTNFPAGYKVIGFLKNNLKTLTYYWLTNPETTFSSFGYVLDRLTEHLNDDLTQDCVDCGEANVLGVALENTTQTPEFEYVELINDSCLPKGEGLNFHVNFPIKSPVLKTEQSGTRVYWEDNRNRPRFIVTDDVTYLYRENNPCGDDIVTDCIQIQKLNQFPDSTPLEVEVISQNTGGNLRRGTYEIFVAYSDELGAEMSDYSTGSNTVKIFDINSRVLESQTLDTTTNYAIAVRINNLDFSNFKYYKVVVVERGVLDSTQIAFEQGIYPTTTNEVTITSSGRLYTNTDRDTNLSPKKNINLNTLFLRKPKIEKGVGEAMIGDRKYIHGVKRKEEINIQPIVNLFSPLAEWQTVLAKEDLYEDGALGSKYGTYRRDEVQPFSLRLLNKDGSKSTAFPMVSRPSDDSDRAFVSQDIIDEFAGLDCSTTDRKEKWQYYNTGKITGQCETIEDGVEIFQAETRACIIENVFTIPQNTITLEVEKEFTTLQDYIEDNPDLNIPAITPFLNDTYPSIHCYPSFGTISTSGELVIGKTYVIHNVNAGDNFSNVGFVNVHEQFVAVGTTPTTWTNATEVEETFCDLPELSETSVKINTVENEEVNKEEALFPEGYDKLSSGDCSFYMVGNNGKPEIDEEFAMGYDAKLYGTIIDGVKLTPNKIYKRTYNFSNESCSTSDITQEIDNFTTLQKYWFRYQGADTLAELETSKLATPSSVEDGFSQPIKKTALWYKVQPSEDNKFVIEVSKTQDPSPKDVLTRNGKNKQQKVRISFFNSCSDQDAFYSKVYSAKSEGFQALLEKGNDSISINDGSTIQNITLINPISNGVLYVVIDPCTVDGIGGAEDPEAEFGYSQNTTTTVIRYRTAPPHGCFSVAIRPIVYTKAIVTWSGITLDKTETYTTSCKYVLPKDLNCEPMPYQKGEFSFWESTSTYPDNKDLYDGSNLKIKPQDLNFQPFSLRTKFERYFVDGYDSNGYYNLKQDLVDLRCKPIRHFKFPDNSLVPFCTNINLPQGAESYIFPIGVSLNVRLVQSMLEVAYVNGLITKEQKDNVVGFEILRGDNTYSRSVVASGLMFDTYKYEKDKKEIYYSNFPYNDLGDDLYHFKDNKTTELIKHPFNGVKNNKFTFISPDLLYNKTTLPFEVSIPGFLRGFAESNFTKLEDHARWTILGKKARNTATTLAVAEAVLETAIAIGTTTGNQWFLVGLSSGTSLGLVGTAIITSANLISGFTNIGKYRYQWLETFRNLGASYNFAYYGYGRGNYSNFLVNRKEQNRLRRLSVAKYLPSGDFNMLDKGVQKPYNVNNFQREESVFLSTGIKYIDYPTEYSQLDNSNFSNVSSKTISSRVGCDLDSFTSKIGSPYAVLKNYVPDQYGEIGTVNWLTTGKAMYFGRDNNCDPVFGGGISISRLAYKRKMPLFRRTAFNYPDKTTYEYSSAYNVGRTRFYCDYETDTEYNGLVIPFPDIDSDYRFDCLNSSNRFYIKGGKFYTAHFSMVDFLVESEMNLNYRFGGKELKEQFYPLASDLERYTQEKNVSIREQEMLQYSNVYSLPNIYSGATILPYSYNKEFYKKIAQNTNEVVWSEQDLNEVNRIQDPYLVYKPANTFSFESAVGELKSLKESTRNQAVARFTDGMQVFNTVDVLADKLTPQTKELGTGGIFAQGRPVNFVNSSLGFSGTQHHNILETEYGDLHIDSERGQILMLNNQANGLEDVAYSIQGEPTYMSKWFKANLPFKIKKYFPNVDIDNAFNEIGISGGYDAVNKRAFITKKDYIPAKRCKEISCADGNLVVNGNFETDLSGWDNYQDGYSWSNGKMWNTDSADIVPKIRQNIMTVGKKYKITFDLFINPTCQDPSVIGYPPKFVKVFAGATESGFITEEGNTKQSLTMTCTENGNFEFQTGFSCRVGYDYNKIGITNVCVIEKKDKDVLPGDPNCILEEGCIEYYEGEGFFLNEAECGSTPQIASCTEGYTYNSVSNSCTKTLTTPPCPEGYYYENGQCVEESSNNNTCNTDLVLVLDASGSVNPSEMEQQKTFVVNLINSLENDITEQRVKIGIVWFNKTVTANVLNLSFNVTNIKNTILAQTTVPNALTNTLEGLSLAQTYLFGANSRSFATKSLILVTDGIPNQLPTVLNKGGELKDAGVYITTVALGSNNDLRTVLCSIGGAENTVTLPPTTYECAQFAGSPYPNYPLSSVGTGMFGYSTYYASFDNALGIAEDILGTVCQSVTTINCGDCEFNKETNLCECEDEIAPTYKDVLTPISVNDPKYFQEVSWTIALKFEEKSFNSYFSFYPNYYNSHQNFFQTGYNELTSSELWSHTLENNSFQVFQGKLHPFIVESTITNKNTSKFLNVLQLETEALRYQNDWNFSQWSSKGFDTITVYNNTNNSGRLKLKPFKSISDSKKYPITNSDNTQSITFAEVDERQIINYFFNRVKNESRNIPQWLWDYNMINKTINPKIVSFTGKKLLERMRGNTFIVRLENQSESRFKINFKDIIQEETNYDN